MEGKRESIRPGVVRPIVKAGHVGVVLPGLEALVQHRPALWVERTNGQREVSEHPGVGEVEFSTREIREDPWHYLYREEKLGKR
jgi:hypothetical protein